MRRRWLSGTDRRWTYGRAMDTSRLTTGDIIAGVGGIVLLISLFLPWYGVSVDIAGVSASESGSGWEALGFIDILLFLISVAAIGIVAARAAGSLPDDIPAPVILLGLGALAVLLVLYRIIDIPVEGDVPAQVDFSRKLGIFIALIGSAAVAYGGWRTNTETPRRARRTARHGSAVVRSLRDLQKGRRRPEGRAAVRGLELRESALARCEP